jgi:hypothetical protein
VRIWNDRGALTLTAMMNASLPAGVVAGQLDWAKLSADGGNVNALTSERLTDIGAGATFYSTLVEVGAGGRSGRRCLEQTEGRDESRSCWTQRRTRLRSGRSLCILATRGWGWGR